MRVEYRLPDASPDKSTALIVPLAVVRHISRDNLVGRLASAQGRLIAETDCATLGDEWIPCEILDGVIINQV